MSGAGSGRQQRVRRRGDGVKTCRERARSVVSCRSSRSHTQINRRNESPPHRGEDLRAEGALLRLELLPEGAEGRQRGHGPRGPHLRRREGALASRRGTGRGAWRGALVRRRRRTFGHFAGLCDEGRERGMREARRRDLLEGEGARGRAHVGEPGRDVRRGAGARGRREPGDDAASCRERGD